MITKPNSHSHVIGFPYHADSNNNNIDKHNNERLITSIYKPLYELSNRYLEKGYNVLYVAEPLPNERDKARVVENIQNANEDNKEQIQSSVSKGQLTVIDSQVIYKKNTSGRAIVDFLLSNVSNMQKKAKETMIFNAPDQFFSRGKYDVFMGFEEKIDKTLPKDVGLLCWYKRKWLSNLSLSYVSRLLAHHKYTIHDDWKYKKWDPNKIIDVVSKGIDNNLGEGSSILLFQTMKSAYKLNRDTIIYRPTTFEETLRKLLNKDDANSVIKSIFEEIVREVQFSLAGNSSNNR